MRGSASGRRSNWPRLLPGSAEAYAFATLLIMLASLLRWGLGFFTTNLTGIHDVLSRGAFCRAFGRGGRWNICHHLRRNYQLVGLPASLLVLLPLTRGRRNQPGDFLFSSIVIVWATDHYRRLTKRLQDEEGFRKLAVEELAHRLKNKLATIQAIVNFRLREHPQVSDEIVGALTALTATDDLITATQGQGARIGDILSTELAPYDVRGYRWMGRTVCFRQSSL